MFKKFCNWMETQFSPATLGGVSRAFVLLLVLLVLSIFVIKWYAPIDAETLKSIATPVMLVVFFYSLAAIRNGARYCLRGKSEE